MPTFSAIAAKPVALMVLVCLSAIPAQASPPVEVFSHNAGSSNGLKPLHSSASLKHDAETPKIGAGPLAIMSADKPIVHWFEDYDRAKADAKPTPVEQLILSRPMNQEFSRVQEFINTVGSIAKRFRALAKTLRKMPVQDNWAQVKELRDGEADFYEQTASVFEEMIKPRPPSKTKEELTAKQNELLDHANAAKQYGTVLISMDRKLRTTYGVHLDRDKDDIAKYVMGSQKEGNYVFPK
jgi:hypothetical protein